MRITVNSVGSKLDLYALRICTGASTFGGFKLDFVSNTCGPNSVSDSHVSRISFFKNSCKIKDFLPSAFVKMFKQQILVQDIRALKSK